MSPFNVNETVKVSDPNKPGDFRIISKSVYDQNPEAYELFSQYDPNKKKTEKTPPPSTPVFPDKPNMEEFEKTVNGMSDEEVKATAETANIEEGDWTREQMVDFIVDQEKRDRMHKIYMETDFEVVRGLAKYLELTGWGSSKHETLAEKLVDHAFKDESE